MASKWLAHLIGLGAVQQQQLAHGDDVPHWANLEQESLEPQPHRC